GRYTAITARGCCRSANRPPAMVSFLQGPQLVRYRRAAAGSRAATARLAGRKTVLPFRFARYLKGKLIYSPRQGWGADFTEACTRKNACLQPSQGCGHAFLSSRTTGPPS